MEKFKIPMYYHNCETSHYVLYSNGVMKSAEDDKHFIKPRDLIYYGIDPEGLTILKILCLVDNFIIVGYSFLYLRKNKNNITLEKVKLGYNSFYIKLKTNKENKNN